MFKEGSSYTGILLNAHRALEGVMAGCGRLEDNDMNALVEAQALVREILIKEPAHCVSDVRNKLRLAADLRDNDHSEYVCEGRLLERVLGDQVALCQMGGKVGEAA